MSMVNEQDPNKPTDEPTPEPEKKEEELYPEEPKKEEEGEPEKKEGEEAEEEPKKEEEEAPQIAAEDVKIPEGFELDEPTRDKFLSIMNNRELSPQEQAQALVDLQAEAMSAASEKVSEHWQETQDKWQEEIKNDPTFGGENLDKHSAAISKLLSTYAEDEKELRSVMDLTGAGNNPHMWRFLAKVADDLGEGRPVPGQPTNQSKDPASVLYPEQEKT